MKKLLGYALVLLFFCAAAQGQNSTQFNSGFISATRIAYATSPDGLNWTRWSGNNCGATTGIGCSERSEGTEARSAGEGFGTCKLG